MDFKGLSDDDLLVLIGVSRVLINIDDLLSFEEVDWVRALIVQIGQSRWRPLALRSEDEFRSTDELITALERVQSPEVRGFILDEARALAEVDGLESVETALLERLEVARGA